jgi:transcriptional regulator with XRE-family HTH domain
MTLPARLRRAREDAGLDLKQLSLRAGLSHNTAFSIEHGTRMPAIDTVAALAQVLSVRADWLGFGEGQPASLPEPDNSSTLASRLRDTRIAQGLSYRAVAQAAGVSDMTVRATERGQTMPTIDTAERMAKALSVSPGWLAFGAPSATSVQTISTE